MRYFLVGAFIACALYCVSYAIPNQSVCSRTGLTGAAAQENDLYCKDFDIAPSTYNEVIDFAVATNYVMGSAEKVFESIDRNGCPITVVRFDRGGHAEHHNLNSPCAPDLLVRLYDPNGRWMWTEK